MADPALDIDPSATVSPDARIHPSVRGTRIRIGAHSHVYDFVVIRAVGGTGDIEIGAHCHINPHCTLYSGSGIRFGNYVMVGPNVSVVPANHAFARRDAPMRVQGFAPSKGGVVVADDVWIGAGAVLLDGARIGKGAVIAAGAVVDGEVPPYEIWGGVPAAFLKKRP
jgi:acetyltransferase-like isoleucine patch superfamily enzyme